MKMKQKYTLALATMLLLAAALSLSTIAQNKQTKLPPYHHMLLSTEVGNGSSYETLSGINLYHVGKGIYQLDFSQKLKENATLSIINTAKKVVYQKPVSIKGNKFSWRYKVGKLKPDTYLVEVVTSDTTYWTKFKIGR